MNSRTSNLSIDTLGTYGQPTTGAAANAPAVKSNKIQVPRRLNDAVQLSRESSSQDEASASDLCSNFMAAWG